MLVTHHVEEIPPGYTHALLLRGGQVVAAGPVDEVLTEAALSETFGLRLAVDPRGRPLHRPARPAPLAKVPAWHEPEFVTLQVEDGVGTIRLDRPKMNAIDEQLHREVRAAAQEAGRRDDVRAVVVYGGERVFAAGADIKAMSRARRLGHGAWGRDLTHASRRWRACPSR